MILDVTGASVEIHRAPGPPRTTIVLVGGTRIAVLEVGPGRDSGAVHHANRRQWTVQRPPGATEWWVADDDGAPLATVGRRTLVRERFTIGLGEQTLELVPIGTPWRRHWSVVDQADREVMELLQRPLSRTVHDLMARSGDLPPESPLLVAWVLAMATSDRLAEPRRPRWTVT